MLILFAIAYFSYGAFQNHSYGWGDMYVHHAWIYGLKEGNIFSAGVYPEAMHCFIYSMDVLFGISIYSCLLFLGEIHVATLLVAVYCLFREILKSRYTVYLILAAFLTIDVVCIDEIYGIARLQYTIPQEFGLYTLFLCTLYLIRFLKRETKGFDGNLFLFMTSLAASLAIHFYVTIMAFFLCASFAVFGLNQIFRKKNFGVLVTAVILGVVISTLPMVLAFASGIPLQGSLNWGMNIINGTDTKEGRSQAVQTSTEESTEAMTGITAEKGSENASSLPSQSQLDSQQGTVIEMESSTNVPKTPLVKRVADAVIRSLKLVYQYGYVHLYGRSRAGWLLRFTIIAAILTLVNVVISIVRLKKISFSMYAGITTASFLFMLLYAAPFLGLPEIIAGARLCLPEQILLLAMMAIPADELFFLLEKTKAGHFAPQISLAGVLAIYAGTNYFGVFHSYLYYELTRYNAAVELTSEIMDAYPQYSYTIISTTEELYQSVEDARHEEILDFYNKSRLVDYYIPTEYLFFYIEKNPIYYAQYHFFRSRWLAQDKYTKYYEYSTAVLSIGDGIEHSRISEEELLGKSLLTTSKASDAYSVIIKPDDSGIGDVPLVQEFKTRLPNEIKVITKMKISSAMW